MSQAQDILNALGGQDNIKELEACITRIRVSASDTDKVNEDALKQAGAFGVVTVGNSVQVIMGPQADDIVKSIQELL